MVCWSEDGRKLLGEVWKKRVSSMKVWFAKVLCNHFLPPKNFHYAAVVCSWFLSCCVACFWNKRVNLFSSLFTLLLLSPISLQGEWASGCLGLSCLPGLNHSIASQCNRIVGPISWSSQQHVSDLASHSGVWWLNLKTACGPSSVDAAFRRAEIKCWSDIPTIQSKSLCCPLQRAVTATEEKDENKWKIFICI